MTQGEASMKLRTHVVLALLQFLSACLGVLGILLLCGMLGYVEPLWWGGKALIVPLFALEGLGLAVIPSYVLAFRLLKFEWGQGAVLRVLCLGLIQGMLFPLIVATMAWVGWMNDRFGTDAFWWLMAIFLTLAAIAGAVASALFMQKITSPRRV